MAALLAPSRTLAGQELVGDSLVIVVGPSPYSDQVSHLYFVDPLGHPLVYFQATRRSQFPTMALERTPLGCVK